MARRDQSPGPPRTTFALRIGDNERRIIEAAAAQQGEALSAYIRRVSLESARRDLADVRALR